MFSMPLAWNFSISEMYSGTWEEQVGVKLQHGRVSLYLGSSGAQQTHAPGTPTMTFLPGRSSSETSALALLSITKRASVSVLPANRACLARPLPSKPDRKQPQQSGLSHAHRELLELDARAELGSDGGRDDASSESGCSAERWRQNLASVGAMLRPNSP